MDFNKDVKIDESALDVEWLDQAALARKWGIYYAECKRTVSLAEEKVKVIRAELINEANENPTECCYKDKPNAADIEAYYRSHPDHKKAKQELIAAQFELDNAEIAKNEIVFTRKEALENLVRLHGQQYFAGPAVARNLSEAREKRNSEINERIGRALRRTK